MQNITINGRLGRDANLRETTNGNRFVSFTVAVNSHIRGAEKTTWYDVMSFNQNHIGNLVKYLTKGTSVIIVGELDVATYTANDGSVHPRLSITADRIDFCGSGLSGNTENNTAVVSEEPVVATPAVTKKSKKQVIVEEDIPVVATTVTEPSSGDGDDDLPF